MRFFRGKFAEAIDLGEKEKLEIPGGWGGGVQRPSGTGVWIFSGTAHLEKIARFENAALVRSRAEENRENLSILLIDCFIY